jgi:hypothetical protein
MNVFGRRLAATMHGEGDPAAVRNRPLSNNEHDRA